MKITLFLVLLILFLCPMSARADSSAGRTAYERGDYAAAHQTLRSAAEQGDADAQFLMGQVFAGGQGVQQDFAVALGWYLKAAEQDHAGAQSFLGHMYYSGRGVPKDDAQAFKWYRRAAGQGTAGAQLILGVMYGAGQGVPKDFVQAYFWLSLAAAQSFPKAEEVRDAFEKEMTPDQTAEAQRLLAAASGVGLADVGSQRASKPHSAALNAIEATPSSNGVQQTRPLAFGDFPEHDAILAMLRAAGENEILETAESVLVSTSGNSAIAVIEHARQGTPVKTEVYLLREQDEWSAFLDLPIGKDHPGVFFFLARQHCMNRFKNLMGLSYIDDSWQSSDPRIRTINVDCSELVNDQWTSNQLVLVYEFVPGTGWTVTKELPYAELKAEPTAEPVTLQGVMQMSDLQTAIFTSYSHGDGKALKLIASGADVNTVDVQRNTPLHTAVSVRQRSEKIIQALLSAGAKVNAVNEYGYAPLHILAQGAVDEDAPVAALLIAGGADVNIRDLDGQTPLHHMSINALGCKGLAVARALIDAGADLAIKDKRGQTPLDMALKFNCSDLSNLFQKAGAR